MQNRNPVLSNKQLKAKFRLKRKLIQSILKSIIQIILEVKALCVLLHEKGISNKIVISESCLKWEKPVVGVCI
jgi:hypothetical protein